MQGIVVACGPSLRKQSWERMLMLDAVRIGMNDAPLWPVSKTQPRWRESLDYLCVINKHWYETFPHVLEAYAYRNRLITLARSDGKEVPIGRKIKSFKEDYFSFDIEKGFYAGNATIFSLQWAVHLGLNPIYILGLDLKGDHGTSDRPSSELNHKKQLKQFEGLNERLLAKGFKVYNCNPDSALKEFEFKAL